MAATTDTVLFGVRQMRIKAALSTCAADPSSTQYDIDNPQNVSIVAVYEDGGRYVLRGGDEIIAVIEEDDRIVGFDVSFQVAELMPEIDEAIVGGVATPASDEWESPLDSTEYPNPFKMYMWVADYTESISGSTQDGFIMFTFPCCKGRRDTETHADLAFGAPSYVAKARNVGETEGAMKYEHAAAIT